MEERERRNAVAQNRSITIGAENEVRKVVVGDRLNVCICFIEIEFVPTRRRRCRQTYLLTLCAPGTRAGVAFEITF